MRMQPAANQARLAAAIGASLPKPPTFSTTTNHTANPTNVHSSCLCFGRAFSNDDHPSNNLNLTSSSNTIKSEYYPDNL